MSLSDQVNKRPAPPTLADLDAAAEPPAPPRRKPAQPAAVPRVATREDAPSVETAERDLRPSEPATPPHSLRPLDTNPRDRHGLPILRGGQYIIPANHHKGRVRVEVVGVTAGVVRVREIDLLDTNSLGKTYPIEPKLLILPDRWRDPIELTRLCVSCGADMRKNNHHETCGQCRRKTHKGRRKETNR